jgi:hypothetical protein
MTSDQPTPAPAPKPMRKTHPTVLGIALGIPLGIVAMIVIAVILRERASRMVPGYAVSAQQIWAVGAAVERFARDSNGRRPATLEELVGKGLVRREDLFDATRGKPPAVDARMRRFVEPPDVIYFPALRADDPNGLVLLCTLLLHNEDDKYQVIYNDGRRAAVTGRELIPALNRTYSYISSRIWPTPPATTSPALAP